MKLNIITKRGTETRIDERGNLTIVCACGKVSPVVNPTMNAGGMAFAVNKLAKWSDHHG